MQSHFAMGDQERVRYLAGKNSMRKISSPQSARDLVLNFANTHELKEWELDSDYDSSIHFWGTCGNIWVEFEACRTLLIRMNSGVTVGKAKFYHCQEALILATLEAWLGSDIVEASFDDTEDAKRTVAAKSVIGVLAASIRGNWRDDVRSRLRHMSDLAKAYYPKRLDWIDWLNDKENLWAAEEDGRHMRDSWSKVGPYIESCPKSYFDLVGLDVEELGSCWDAHVDK